MSNAIVSVLHVDTPAMPRGAVWAGQLFSALLYVFSLPQARKLSRAEEAAAVREMARSLQDTDPGFASDLMGAACRHEAKDD